MSEQEKKWRGEFESYWIDNVEIEGNASQEWIADAAFLAAKRQDADRIAKLEAEIARLNHQHANDEAANRMLSDACAAQEARIKSLELELRRR